MTNGPWTIWLASFPKSGNTWVRALLTSLDEGEGGEVDINALGHGPIAAGRWHLERFSGLSSGELTPGEIDRLRPAVDRYLDAQSDRLRFRKIHDTLFGGYGGAPIVAPDATRGAVYVARDPRDVAVSWSHYMGIDPERAVEQLADRHGAYESATRRLNLQVRQRVGSWSDHVRGWLDQDLFEVLLVRYEDLEADTARELTRIVRFAGLDANPPEVAAAVEASTFGRLRSQEAEHGFRERSAPDRPFFRRGTSGAWRDQLAPEIAHRVERDHAEVMARLGYTPSGDAARVAVSG